jgi:hypothetical protein
MSAMRSHRALSSCGGSVTKTQAVLGFVEASEVRLVGGDRKPRSPMEGADHADQSCLDSHGADSRRTRTGGTPLEQARRQPYAPEVEGGTRCAGRADAPWYLPERTVRSGRAPSSCSSVMCARAAPHAGRSAPRTSGITAKQCPSAAQDRTSEYRPTCRGKAVRPAGDVEPSCSQTSGAW